MKAFALASILFLASLNQSLSADTWVPKPTEINFRQCMPWAAAKEVLSSRNETARASYRDDWGNDWVLFVADGGSWTVLVMPSHMKSFIGVCVQGAGERGFPVREKT